MKDEYKFILKVSILAFVIVAIMLSFASCTYVNVEVKVELPDTDDDAEWQP